MDENAKAEGRRILRAWLDEEETDMAKLTKNETALHTILSHCRKPYPPTQGSADRREQLITRLMEIQSVVEERVLKNALDNVS